MKDINKLYRDYCPEDEKSYTCQDCSRQFIPTPDDNFSLTHCYSCIEEGAMWKDEDDDGDIKDEGYYEVTFIFDQVEYEIKGTIISENMFKTNEIKNAAWRGNKRLFSDLQMSPEQLVLKFARVIGCLKNTTWNVLIGKCDRNTCQNKLSYLCSDECRKERRWKMEHIDYDDED